MIPKAHNHKWDPFIVSLVEARGNYERYDSNHGSNDER